MPAESIASARQDGAQKVLARNVRVAREQLDWTHRDLAAVAKMSQQHVAMIETTGANATILTLARLAKCLDTTVLDC